MGSSNLIMGEGKDTRRERSRNLLTNSYLQLFPDMLLSSVPGDVAQLGERDNRTVEVRGSSPLISTMYYTLETCRLRDLKSLANRKR